MSDRKRIAAIITEYRVPAHADVIVGKFIKGFPTDDGLLDPQVEIVSMYLDQLPPNDIGMAVSERYGIPVFRSIPSALCLGGDELAVDGVLAIAEHGDYAYNEKGQNMYPRRYFMEQICGVIASRGRPIPVYSDKHLSYNWQDARWVYERTRALEVPFMAGSSLPLAWRDPWLEHEIGTPIEEAVVIGPGQLDSYGFHSLEALQCMVERRAGGESGVAAVRYLEGDQIWTAAAAGAWSRELAEAALDRITDREEGPLAGICDEAYAILLEYRDGLRAAVLQLPGAVREWGYAGRVDGRVESTDMNTHRSNPHPIFSYLGLNIQEMFMTGAAQYPVERTLLVSGVLEVAVDSKFQAGARLETPHLDVVYQPSSRQPIRPRGVHPTGASIVPWTDEQI